MHSRDITILIVLLWYCALASVLFLSMYYRPLKFLFYNTSSLTFFCNIDWLMNPRIPHHKVVMILYASIISESEVFIMVLCLPCLPHYTAVRIKNCSISMSNQSSHYEKYDGTACPSYPLKLKYPLPFSVSYEIFNSIHSSMNQEVFEKHL